MYALVPPRLWQNGAPITTERHRQGKCRLQSHQDAISGGAFKGPSNCESQWGPTSSDDLIGSLLGDYECVSACHAVAEPAEHAVLSPPGSKLNMLASQEQGSAMAKDEPSTGTVHVAGMLASGCVGQFGLGNRPALPYAYLATFRQYGHLAALPISNECVQIVQHPAHRAPFGVADADLLHDRDERKAALQRVAHLHTRLFPSCSGTTQDPDPHMRATRDAFVALHFEHMLLPLVYAGADSATWQKRHERYKYGLISAHDGHLGHIFPAMWSWRKGATAVQFCIERYQSQFLRKAEHVLSRGRRQNDDVSMWRARQRAFLKAFEKGLPAHAADSCVAKYLKAPATMAMSQIAARDVLIDQLLRHILMVGFL
eukprot:jgi/Ulvmu1/7607/UM038_0032.1